MGKMKATLPDYSPVEYELDQPIENLDLKMWAMGQALQHVSKDNCTFHEHGERVRVFANILLKQIKKLEQ